MSALAHATQADNRLTKAEYESLTEHTLDSGVAGEVLFFDGTQIVGTGAGTDGYVLTLVAGVPTWVTAGSTVTGPLRLADGSAAAPSYSFSGATSTGIFRRVGNELDISLGGTGYFLFNAAAMQMASTVVISWGATTYDSGGDLVLLRDAANTLAQRNGVVAQTFRLYNTYTDGSNNERFQATWVGNKVFLITSAVGTGTVRALGLGTSGTSQWTITTSGHLTADADNTYDIGAAGATRPRSLYVGTNITFGGVSLGANGSSGAPTYSFSGETTTGIYKTGASTVDISLGGTRSYAFHTTGAYFLSNSMSLFLGESSDLVLTRDAANMLAQRNGVNAQAFNIYNTYTNASNYERFEASWGANVLSLRTAAAGTGTQRALWIYTMGSAALSFGTNNTLRWNISSSGHFLAQADNTYDIGASGATRPRSIYLATALIGPGTVSSVYTIRLANDQYIGWRNAANSLNYYLGVDGGDKLTTNAHFSVGGSANRSITQPTNSISMFNGTAPSGTLANGATFYVDAGEMWVMDAGGTPTQLSPHDPEGFWWFNSRTREGKKLQIEVEKILRYVNEKYNLNLIHELEDAGIV